MSTKLRKQDNTFITIEEILASGGGLEVADGSGTENFIPYFDGDGKLADSRVYENEDYVYLHKEDSLDTGYIRIHKIEKDIYMYSQIDADFADFYLTTTSTSYIDVYGNKFEFWTDVAFEFHLDSGAKFKILNLPTSAAGLSTGDVWNDSGVLKIV